MNLRPHHLLCIQKFVGYGYSDAFTKHLAEIVALLKKDPKTSVTLTEGCDSVCSACPENVDGVCRTEEKVLAMDNAVLESCLFGYGECRSFEELAEKARTEILESDRFDEICSSCQWFGICKEI